MPIKAAKKSKRDALKRHGTLNPHPNAVTDPLFQTGDFFDRNDLVQVKYEMLRRVTVDKQSVTQSATAFGFSRPTYYQAEADFSGMASSGYCPRSEVPGKATNSRRRFWTSLRNSERAILRCVHWTWLLPSRNGSL